MNLHDAERIANELMAQHLVKFPGWVFAFDTAKRRAGCCHYCTKTISLSAEYVGLNQEADIIDVIKHEICHVLAGAAAGHGRLWKLTAISIGAKPERCTSTAVTSTGRYVGTCSDCSAELSLHRLGKMIKHGAVHHPCRFKPNRGSIKMWRDRKTGQLIQSVPRQFDPAKQDVLDKFKKWDRERQVA